MRAVWDRYWISRFVSVSTYRKCRENCCVDGITHRRSHNLLHHRHFYGFEWLDQFFLRFSCTSFWFASELISQRHIVSFHCHLIKRRRFVRSQCFFPFIRLTAYFLCLQKTRRRKTDAERVRWILHFFLIVFICIDGYCFVLCERPFSFTHSFYACNDHSVMPASQYFSSFLPNNFRNFFGLSHCEIAKCVSSICSTWTMNVERVSDRLHEIVDQSPTMMWYVLSLL